MILRIKYRFSKYPRLFKAKSGELIQMHFTSKNGQEYPCRELKEVIHQGSLKYIINRKYVSKKQLNECAYLVDEQYNTKQLKKKDLPF